MGSTSLADGSAAARAGRQLEGSITRERGTLLRVAVTKTGRQTAESRVYRFSLRADERSHAGWHALLRAHWAGVEIRNQWRRDAVWGEDRSLTRNPTALANLALWRRTWLARDRDERSLPELIESFAVAPAVAFKLINSF